MSKTKPEELKGQVVGSPIHRVGGAERVTGRQRYVADILIPNMLHAKLVKLDCAHAKIRSIDISDAMKVSGVHAVFTGDDLPRPLVRFGPIHQDRPLMAVEETRFHGEPVAIVVADTIDAAEEAAALVHVDYEVLPAVFTVEGALDPEAPLVQDPVTRPEGRFQKTNILDEYHFGWGDVDSVTADLVIENDYFFPMVTQFAIEPFAFMAAPERDVMTVWSAVQNPNFLQKVIARSLGRPLSKVRVIAPDPGGGFGGKQHAKFEPLLAFAAQKLGRGIRLELSLAESFQAVRRTAVRVKARSGFSSEGKFLFQDLKADFLIGAYADITPRIVQKSSYAAAGPYKVGSVRTVSRALLSHTMPSTAFRGFGVPQFNWAVENQIDLASRELGIDPVEIRLRNLPEHGEHFLPDDPAADGQWDQVLRKAAKAIGWGTPVGKNRGRGISMGIKMSATTAASYSIVRLHQDGSATVMAGTSDMGQGARTIFSQIVAQELHTPVENVNVVMGDTASVPFDLQTTASRSSVYMGTAILRACKDVQRQLKEAVARKYGSGDPELCEGYFKAGTREITFTQILDDLFGGVSGEVIGVGSARAEKRRNHPLGGHTVFFEVVCSAVELEVDPETGETIIHKLVTAGDVGKALNPQHVQMQDDGAAIMGLGHAVMEHYIFDDNGKLKNSSALDYRIPTSKDIPRKIESLLVENEDGPGPYGSKGVAESGLLTIASAVGIAVHNATGVFFQELPLTPERIWRAIANKKRD